MFDFFLLLMLGSPIYASKISALGGYTHEILGNIVHTPKGISLRKTTRFDFWALISPHLTRAIRRRNQDIGENWGNFGVPALTPCITEKPQY